MKQNKYDDDAFFEKYSHMDRSVKGLAGAGEWECLQKMLPNFYGKRLLDLGCGFGWHCQYAMEQGALSATGVDISENMLKQAKEKNRFTNVKYICSAMEDITFPPNTFDIILSSLAFHYVPSFEEIVKKVCQCLSVDGNFIFSVEHPVYTAYGSQDWIYDAEGNILHFPVDNYFLEGKRNAIFLGEEIIKYHHTLTTYLNTLLTNGFSITQIVEPQPPRHMLESVEGMKDELRRPMMLLVAAQKRG